MAGIVKTKAEECPACGVSTRDMEPFIEVQYKQEPGDSWIGSKNLPVAGFKFTCRRCGHFWYEKKES